jgi:hypothetical protein
MMAIPCTCVICGLPFDARTAYGLCPLCISKDRLREFDRVESAKRSAERAKLPVTLTLVQWLSVLSDFNGRCAYCLYHTSALIEMVAPMDGLTYENVAPICRGCHEHKRHGFETAIQRVQEYLSGDRDETILVFAVEDEEVSA